MYNSLESLVEHAPPKGFFPKNMRTNLITVPSCRLHNEDTSSDDEYVKNIVSMMIENNQTSIDHFFDKTLRSFKRNKVMSAQIRDSLKDVSTFKEGAKSFEIDRVRFDKIIRKISYALFYNEYGYSWERLLAVTTNQLKMGNTGNDHLGHMFESFEEDLDTLQLKGSNPNVFQYSFLNLGNGIHEKALFMIFYEGFPFMIIPDANSSSASFN